MSHENTNPAHQNPNARVGQLTLVDRVVRILSDASFKERLAGVLSQYGVSADRFARTALSAVSQSAPALERCSPTSIGSAILRAASMNLDLDPVLGHAYLVPRRAQATLQISYRGRMELARRSGQLIAMDVGTIHEHDTASLVRGTKPSLTVAIPLDGKRGAILGYYCAAQWKDGGTTVEYMHLDEVIAHRDAHSDEWKRRGASSVWGTNFDAMAKKTVIVRASKTWPIVAIPDDDENGAASGHDARIAAPENTVDTLPPPNSIVGNKMMSGRLANFVAPREVHDSLMMETE